MHRHHCEFFFGSRRRDLQELPKFCLEIRKPQGSKSRRPKCGLRVHHSGGYARGAGDESYATSSVSGKASFMETSHDESPSAGSGNRYCKTIEITSGLRRAARLVGTVGTTGSPSLKRICYQRKQKRPRTLKSKNSMRVSRRNSACAEFRTSPRRLPAVPGSRRGSSRSRIIL